MQFRDKMAAVCCCADEEENSKVASKAAGQTMALRYLNLWHNQLSNDQRYDQEYLKRHCPVLVSFI
jgi:hypothetical protein